MRQTAVIRCRDCPDEHIIPFEYRSLLCFFNTLFYQPPSAFCSPLPLHIPMSLQSSGVSLTLPGQASLGHNYPYQLPSLG